MPCNVVKQGCVLALMFSALLTDALRDDVIGVGFRYPTDRKLLNPRKMQAKTKVNEDAVRDFVFADNRAPNATT